MSYPIEKYKFYYPPNKVIAVSSFAGQTVRGVAKCAQSDEFDLEKGEKLAAARCNLKVAKKREKRAAMKYFEATHALHLAKQKMEEAKKYFFDSVDQCDDAVEELTELLEKLK